MPNPLLARHFETDAAENGYFLQEDEVIGANPIQGSTIPW
jgi:hypothetical protein